MQKFTWEYPSGDAPEAPEAPCPRLGKWIGGCRFEARHSRGALTGPMPDGFDHYLRHSDHVSANDVAAITALSPSVYEGDVCVRCGKRASRDTQSSPEETEASQAKPQQNTVED